MGHVSPSTGTRGRAGRDSGCRGAVGATNICPATRTLQGLAQRGQARGEGRSGARDPPRLGTPALTFTHRRERAAEAPGPRLEEQPGSRSPEAALQQWKIFFPCWPQGRNLSRSPRGSGKCWGEELPRKAPAQCHRAACTAPAPQGKPHPALPTLWQGLAAAPQAAKPAKRHIFTPWGDVVPLACQCLPAGTPHKPAS